MSEAGVCPAGHIGINGQLLSASQSYRSAGISGYIRQLLLHLPEAAPDLCFTAFVPRRNQPEQAKQTGNLQVRASRWDTTSPQRRILWEQLALPLLGRNLGLDLLHATVNISPMFGPVPAVVTVHDLSFLRYPEAFPAFQRLYLRTQARRSLRSARRVVAVSQATARDVVELLQVPAEHVDVVYNGVDRAFGPAPLAEVDAFRRHRGLPDRFILHLGTLEPRKNLVCLVRAFSVARQSAPFLDDVKLVLAGGKGWDYKSIFHEVARLNLEDDVLFPGYVPDEELPWWYRAATAFAYPSLLEGFGLPVAEAMACGTPTVTSSVSSLPEVADDAALLVDPTSADALASALLRLLTDADLVRFLRERGPAQAARFSWKCTARETADVYRRALN